MTSSEVFDVRVHDVDNVSYSVSAGVPEELLGLACSNSQAGTGPAVAAPASYFGRIMLVMLIRS